MSWLMSRDLWFDVVTLSWSQHLACFGLMLRHCLLVLLSMSRHYIDVSTMSRRCRDIGQLNFTSRLI